MKDEPITIEERNESMIAELRGMGLDPEAVWWPNPDDPRLDNRQLQSILRWARAYRASPDRKILSKRGFTYPPVFPGFDPDNDWLVFERWMNHQPLTWSMAGELKDARKPEDMTDEEIEEELDSLLEKLEERQVRVDFMDDALPRTRYKDLIQILKKSRFDYLAKGVYEHIFCPDPVPDCNEDDIFAIDVFL